MKKFRQITPKHKILRPEIKFRFNEKALQKTGILEIPNAEDLKMILLRRIYHFHENTSHHIILTIPKPVVLLIEKNTNIAEEYGVHLRDNNCCTRCKNKVGSENNVGCRYEGQNAKCKRRKIKSQCKNLSDDEIIITNSQSEVQPYITIPNVTEKNVKHKKFNVERSLKNFIDGEITIEKCSSEIKSSSSSIMLTKRKLLPATVLPSDPKNFNVTSENKRGVSQVAFHDQQDQNMDISICNNDAEKDSDGKAYITSLIMRGSSLGTQTIGNQFKECFIKTNKEDKQFNDEDSSYVPLENRCIFDDLDDICIDQTDEKTEKPTEEEHFCIFEDSGGLWSNENNLKNLHKDAVLAKKNICLYTKQFEEFIEVANPPQEEMQSIHEVTREEEENGDELDVHAVPVIEEPVHILGIVTKEPAKMPEFREADPSISDINQPTQSSANSEVTVAQTNSNDVQTEIIPQLQQTSGNRETEKPVPENSNAESIVKEPVPALGRESLHITCLPKKKLKMRKSVTVKKNWRIKNVKMKKKIPKNSIKLAKIIQLEKKFLIAQEHSYSLDICETPMRHFQTAAASKIVTTEVSEFQESTPVREFGEHSINISADKREDENSELKDAVEESVEIQNRKKLSALVWFSINQEHSYMQPILEESNSFEKKNSDLEELLKIEKKISEKHIVVGENSYFRESSVVVTQNMENCENAIGEDTDVEEIIFGGDICDSVNVITEQITHIDEIEDPLEKEMRNIHDGILIPRENSPILHTEELKETFGQISSVEGFIVKKQRDAVSDGVCSPTPAHVVQSKTEAHLDESSNDTIRELNDYSKKGRDKEPYKCTACDFRVQNKKHLEDHMRSHTQPFWCNGCYRMYAELNDLERHVIELHIAAGIKNCKSNTSLQGFYKCGFCDYTSSYVKRLGNHIKIHKEKTLYTCDKCNYTTLLKWMMRHHKKGHEHVSNEHVCEDCGYMSVYREGLEVHMQLHNKTKAYVCDLCAFSTASASYFNTHLAFHQTKEEVCLPDEEELQRVTNAMFRCQDCLFTTKQYSTIIKHSRMQHAQKSSIRVLVMHHNISVHLCTMCGFITKSQEKLEKHTKVHVDVKKSYKCKVCSFVTDTEFNLQLHDIKHRKLHLPCRCYKCDFQCLTHRELNRHNRAKHDNTKESDHSVEDV